VTFDGIDTRWFFLWIAIADYLTLGIERFAIPDQDYKLESALRAAAIDCLRTPCAESAVLLRPSQELPR
jgi:hypothetical protein